MKELPTVIVDQILSYLPWCAMQTRMIHLKNNTDMVGLDYIPDNITTLKIGPHFTLQIPNLPPHVTTLIIHRKYCETIDHLQVSCIQISPEYKANLPPTVRHVVLSRIKCFADVLYCLINLKHYQYESITIRKRFSKKARKILEKSRPRGSRLIHLYY